MSINASLVMELRETTGLGMMVCKKALTEADGDMKKAIESLRMQGQATAPRQGAGVALRRGRAGRSVIPMEDHLDRQRDHGQ